VLYRRGRGPRHLEKEEKTIPSWAGKTKQGGDFSYVTFVLVLSGTENRSKTRKAFFCFCYAFKGGKRTNTWKYLGDYLKLRGRKRSQQKRKRGAMIM